MASALPSIDIVPSRALLLCQAFMASAVLVLKLVSFRSDDPVLLIPLIPESRQNVAQLASANRTKVLRPGAIGGSLIVRGDMHHPFDVLREHGVLVVPVRFASCGTAAFK